jgi:hypothetical protein
MLAPFDELGTGMKRMMKATRYSVLVPIFAFALSCSSLAQTATPAPEPTTQDNKPAQPRDQSKQDQANPQNLPNAPSSSKPSLSDLGFPPEQTQGNPKEQALLDKRTHMLKIHQKLGFITLFPLGATVISGFGAGGRSTSNSTRDLHAALGGATAGLYFSAAYFAIRAPRVPGTQTRGQIRVHKALAWVHGPGMVLTPILGAMAFDQKSKGQHVHGIAQAHGPVAIVTAGAYGAAFAAVAFKF